jgi:hypothetical protein
LNATKGEVFPGKRVFFGGHHALKNGAWQCFGGSVLISIKGMIFLMTLK